MRQTTNIDSGRDESAFQDELPAPEAAPISRSPVAGTSPFPDQSNEASPQMGFSAWDGAQIDGSRLPTVALVQATWAEILGLDAVDPHDDFFELGGNSLIVATAVARLGERLGIDLPMRALFEAPTPVEMAELIAELPSEHERDRSIEAISTVSDWVIPLQREGSGRPVFVFPAGHGDLRALAYEAQVAALASRTNPFWGFRREHPYLVEARQAGIPVLVAEYVRQMRAIQNTGPYLLYASCAGGYLAWEAARQLLAAGESIAGLLFYEVFLRHDFDALLTGHTPAHISPWWDLSFYYRPQPLPVDLIVLETAEWRARGWSEPWRRVVGRSFEMILIPSGASDTQDVSTRRRETLAEQLRVWIDKAEAGVQSR
jgi:acyl carrier protein